MSDAVLQPTAILNDLRTASLPRSVRCYTQVGSTMDLARELLPTLAESELPLLVLADEQTSGRGRMGRSWIAPPGSALLCSLAMRPTWLPPERAISLVWMAGVALCEAVAEQSGLAPALKWPNDLLLPTPAGPAKAAGILLEASGDDSTIGRVILGMGINVSAAPPPAATRYPATSLADAVGHSIDRLELLRALLRRLDGWYTRLIAGDTQTLFTAWRGRLHTLGRTVTIEQPQGSLTGRAEAVDQSGALLVRDAAGILHTITTGDVGFR